MNVRGPCSSCGAPLAVDQRYCVECGQRVGLPLALPYAVPAPVAAPPTEGGWLAALPMPVQMVSAFAALALGFGAVVGTAISPNLAGIVAAPGPSVVTEQSPTEPPAATGGGGGGGAAPGGPAAATPVASTGPTTSSGGGDGGGGGGQHRKKKRKKKQEAPQTFTGTVVRLNPVAASYTISTGGLIAIHADSLPQVGQRLEVPVRQLANGTYAEAGARNAIGTAESVSFSGTVTYCADLEQPSAPCDGSSTTDHYVYSVSALGASILVSAPHPAQSAPPKVGSRVDVTVNIGAGNFEPIDPTVPPSADPGCAPPPSGLPSPPVGEPELTQTSVNVTGQATASSLEVVVQVTCPGASPKLILSADDVRQAERDLPTLAVPAGIDLSKLTAGQAVQAAVEIAGDGTFTLKGITSDQGAAGANDPAQGQGSLTGS